MIKRILLGLLALAGCVVALLLLAYIYNTQYIESKDPQASAPADTKFIESDGEQIAYSEIDNGVPTTVIFVGGLSAWSGTWARTIESLNAKNKNFSYIAIDLPPFGFSIPDEARNYFRDVQAARLASFVAAKQLEKVILVGHSYGGGPATEYVLHNQDRVAKLILIDAVLNVGETKVVPSYSPVQNGLLRSVLIGVLVHIDSFALSRLKSFVFVTDNINQSLLDVYTQYFDTRHVTKKLSAWLLDYVEDPLVYESTSADAYRALSVPVRLIWGDKDTITPIAGATQLLGLVPHIELYTLRGVGHIPMIEDYAQFDAALQDALTK